MNSPEHGGSPSVTDSTELSREVYNIIPIHDPFADHPSLRLPEVRAVITALREVRNLRRHPFIACRPHYDLLDWLALFFGFQASNVSNQREHIVLHLSNAQMRLSPPPDSIDTLDPTILRRFRRRLLKNYSSWCSYLNLKSNIRLSDSSPNLRRELLYVSLYLLIWGESANLRFMPECISFIFHNMAMELNKILEDYIDEDSGMPFLPSISGDNGYLNKVVKPIYDMIKSEVDNNRITTVPKYAWRMYNDTSDIISEVGSYWMAPYSAWRNYDDINENFWSQQYVKKLQLPINLASAYLVSGNKGKRGFVEQRSFWNVFRSFHRLWVLLILFLQAAIIVAWEERKYPWLAYESRQVKVRCLTVFFTWSAMNFMLSILDGAMQHSLVSTETWLLGVKMVLKVVAAGGWTLLFGYLYWRIWEQINSDGGWSSTVNKRVLTFLEFAFVYMVTELLTSVLFILPCLGIFFENWKIFYPISWWFHTRTFVGRGLQEGLMDRTKYTIFWIAILATKFSFSYFLQIKPMIGPTKTLLRQKDVEFKWHQFFHHSDILAVGLPWLPVVLVYLLDIQIWYSFYSSFLGSLIALFLHLGEIRNMRQLKLRFQFFASALQFNLIPKKQLLNARGIFKSKVRGAIHRLKLRYGLGRPFEKLESNQVETYKFALIWNEIIHIFREEDIICDREVELLELLQNDSNDPKCNWEIRVIQWPCLLLCNELLLALSQANELVDAPDRRLWYKICKNE